ncbi:MAG: hypothetical protein KKH49_05955, partial [Candidatus Omnitrophica bacterium]|nr:hypothetical protein [Candidatus Omnitrophota bacterium]
MTEKFYKPAEGKLSIKGLFAQVLKGECSLQEFPDSILERVYVFKKEDVRQLSGNQNIVERMLNMSIPKSAKLGITGLFTILIFAVVLLPTTRADKLTVKTAEPNAVEIVEKVKSLYVGLDSYSSQGEASLSVNRLSETTEEDFKKAGINKKDFDDSINRYSLNGTFSVKLARPDYYIEWK